VLLEMRVGPRAWVIDEIEVRSAAWQRSRRGSVQPSVFLGINFMIYVSISVSTLTILQFHSSFLVHAKFVLTHYPQT
jgi:hypothetical protein